jgi:hypothetical protein
MINYVVQFTKIFVIYRRKRIFSMEKFEWKDRVDYNVSYGRMVRPFVTLAELHHVNTSCKFRAKSQE